MTTGDMRLMAYSPHVSLPIQTPGKGKIGGKCGDMG
ncbi:hypothetical protein E2C01_068840 [Portunus trituberculatus]|uniref:Uncharacterized protein n=1 Tax=Portunus trituberculatus TaxID=210409 RepID=A0A5B7HPW0_PORTR|nr:hypothetical protein [Portunus trituberculatus]